MPRRIALIIAAVALSLVAASGAAVASEPALDLDDTTVSIEIIDPVTDEVGATPIEPDPTVEDPRPHTWDHVAVSSDGLTLSVYFWMGIEECNGLHSVTVNPTDFGIDLRLATGTPAGAGDMACIEIAQSYVTTVTLDEPLITNSLG